MSDAAFVLQMTAILIGGVLCVAAKFHAYTFRPMTNDDPGKERRRYWWSWLIGGALVTAGTVPYGWQVALAVAFAALFLAVAYGPHFPWNSSRWEP